LFLPKPSGIVPGFPEINFLKLSLSSIGNTLFTLEKKSTLSALANLCRFWSVTFCEEKDRV